MIYVASDATYSCPSNNSTQICEFTIYSSDAEKTIAFQSRYLATVKCKSCALPYIKANFNFNADEQSIIEIIDFSSNQIKELTPDSFFDWTGQIKQLNLSSNKIKLLKQSKLFHNTPGLQTLFLDHNVIQHIALAIFVGSSKLEQVDLSFNRLNRLSIGIFDPLVNLKVLNLNNNQLIKIDSTLVKNNIHLSTFTVANNRIQRFNEIIFDMLKELKMFDMSNNSMEALVLSTDNVTVVGQRSANKINVKQLEKENKDMKDQLVKAYLAADEKEATLELFHEKYRVIENYVRHQTKVTHLQNVITDVFQRLHQNITKVLDNISLHHTTNVKHM